MKFYLHEDGKTVCAFENDGSQDHLIGKKKPISKEIADWHIKKAKETQFNNLDWYRKRMMSYPPLSDFADAWVKNDEAALEEYRQACLAIKAQHPKGAGF